MDEYQTLANTTRNLEQKYLKHLIRKHSAIISKLKEKCSGENSVSREKELLEKRIEENSVRMNQLEQDLDQERSLVQKLREDLQNVKKPKDSAKLQKLEEENKVLMKQNEELKSQKNSTNSDQLQKLEEENKLLIKQNEELKNLKKPKNSAKIQKLEEENKLLMKQNEELKIQKSGSVDLVAVEETQKQILDFVKTFSQTQSQNIEKLNTLEALLKKNDKKTATKEEKFDNSVYIKKIKELEDKVEELKSENLVLGRSESNLKVQKDTIKILEETLNSKNKIIEEQKKEIETLKNKSETPFGGLELPSLEQSSQPVKKTKVQPKGQKSNNKAGELKDDKTAKNTKVNVENLIRDENKSFFNNLSFTNSSPVVNKKSQKK